MWSIVWGHSHTSSPAGMVFPPSTTGRGSTLLPTSSRLPLPSSQRMIFLGEGSGDKPFSVLERVGTSLSFCEGEDNWGERLVVNSKDCAPSCDIFCSTLYVFYYMKKLCSLYSLYCIKALFYMLCNMHPLYSKNCIICIAFYVLLTITKHCVLGNMLSIASQPHSIHPI